MGESENRPAATRQKRKAPRSAFKPGNSANPGGRPKGLAELAELARSHAPEAIAALVRGLKHPKLFVAAATALLDRGFGKPTQPIEGDVGFGSLLAVLEARRRRSDSDAENDASK